VTSGTAHLAGPGRYIWAWLAMLHPGFIDSGGLMNFNLIGAIL